MGYCDEGSIVRRVLKAFTVLLNVGLPVTLALVGAYGIKESTNIDDAQVVFMGIYLILFAAILFIFEFLQLLPLESLDLMYKKNFGYLYGVNGKGMYTLLIGIFAFGLTGESVTTTTSELAQAIGILVAIWGVLQMIVNVVFPDFYDKKEKYQP